jgi:hypothetical protein
VGMLLKHFHSFSKLVCLELEKQWKVTVFYMFCIEKAVCTFNTKNLYGNKIKKLCT